MTADGLAIAALVVLALLVARRFAGSGATPEGIAPVSSDDFGATPEGIAPVSSWAAYDFYTGLPSGTQLGSFYRGYDSFGATPEGFGPLPSGAASELPGGHNEWDKVIRAALRAAGFEAAVIDRYAILVKAIIQQESGWNPKARGDYDPNRCPQPYRAVQGSAGYCSLGFGQIHRYWHPDLASGYNLLDGKRNIDAMAVLLGTIRRAVGEDVRRIAAAWNGGTAAGLAYPRVTAPVQRYVANVAGAWTRWAEQAGLA